MGQRTAGDQEAKSKGLRDANFKIDPNSRQCIGYSLRASWEVFRLFLRLVERASSGPLTLAVTVSLFDNVDSSKQIENQ